MSVNFSSHSLISSSNNISSLLSSLGCLYFEPYSSVFISFTVTNILLLVPLCILVLYHGLQQWQQRSSPPAAAISHSNNFTYHLVIMELMNVLGTIICCCGIHQKVNQMIMVWWYVFAATWYGETCFHVLTCVEHYLAVVHPITYLSLRKERGIRIRNVIIGCIWLLCLGGTSLVVREIETQILDLFLLISSFLIISFCSLSVLCVLSRPGPGEQGRDREKIDQSKQRAFCIIMIILGVLLLRCTWNLIWSVKTLSSTEISKCVWIVTDVWINIPSSLVLPLLFLQRTGLLACCTNR